MVLDIRQQRINNQAARVIRPQAISVSHEWVEQLLKEPFITGNRSGTGSILI